MCVGECVCSCTRTCVCVRMCVCVCVCVRERERERERGASTLKYFTKAIASSINFRLELQYLCSCMHCRAVECIVRF